MKQIQQLHSDGQAQQMNAVQNKRETRCKNCDQSHPYGKQYCPAKNDICHACQKHGHWAKCCFSTKYDEHRTNSPARGRHSTSQHQDRSLEGNAERGNPTRVMGRNHKRMMRIDLAVAIGIFTHWMNNATMAKTDHNVTTMITHHTRMNSHST